MDYISVKEASILWNIDPSNIGKLCRKGKIEGAKIVGRNWLIPKSTKKPVDGRTKAARSEAKEEAKEDLFRFPLYVNFSEGSFSPRLSKDERILRQAQLDFLACDFEKAENSFEMLIESTQNIYVLQISIFFMCLISANYKSGDDFECYYTNLELSLAGDFPHNHEMRLLKPWILSCATLYNDAAEQFSIDDEYEYSPSVYPLMVCLSFGDKESVNNPEIIDIRANVYKLDANQLEKAGYFFEAQTIHIALNLAYYMKNNEKSAAFHLRKALNIALKHNFIYPIAEIYPYYRPLLDKLLKDYPQEFVNKLEQYSNDIEQSFVQFARDNNISKIFSMLSNSDIKFVLYAMQHYSYKQVAKIVRVSERTIANRYNKIYEKLGVEGKQGLLEMIEVSLTKRKGDWKLFNRI